MLFPVAAKVFFRQVGIAQAIQQTATDILIKAVQAEWSKAEVSGEHPQGRVWGELLFLDAVHQHFHRSCIQRIELTGDTLILITLLNNTLRLFC